MKEHKAPEEAWQRPAEPAAPEYVEEPSPDPLAPDPKEPYVERPLSQRIFAWILAGVVIVGVILYYYWIAKG